MITASVTSDPEHPFSRALLTVNGLSQPPESGAFQLIREGFSEPYLGPDGWRASEVDLVPLDASFDAAAAELRLVIGGTVCQHVEPGPLTFRLPAADAEADLFWPDDIAIYDDGSEDGAGMAAAPGMVRVTGVAVKPQIAATVRPGGVTPPLPPTPLPLPPKVSPPQVLPPRVLPTRVLPTKVLPPTPEPADPIVSQAGPDDQAALKGQAGLDETKRARKPLLMLLPVATVLLLAATTYEFWPTPHDPLAPPPITANQPAAPPPARVPSVPPPAPAAQPAQRQSTPPVAVPAVTPPPVQPRPAPPIERPNQGGGFNGGDLAYRRPQDIIAAVRDPQTLVEYAKLKLANKNPEWADQLLEEAAKPQYGPGRNKIWGAAALERGKLYDPSLPHDFDIPQPRADFAIEQYRNAIDRAATPDAAPAASAQLEHLRQWLMQVVQHRTDGPADAADILARNWK